MDFIPCSSVTSDAVAKPVTESKIGDKHYEEMQTAGPNPLLVRHHFVNVLHNPTKLNLYLDE